MAKQDTYLPVVTPVSGDYVIGVDVSDTTDDPGGSTKAFDVAAIAGLVGSWTRDTLTISAAASGTWAIPTGCKAIKFVASALAGSGVSQVLTVGLNVSGGGAASFNKTGFSGASPVTVYSASSTAPMDGWNGGAAATQFAFTGEVLDPRSASIKTTLSGTLLIENTQGSNQEFRSIVAVAVTAEDHDDLFVSVDAGTITGTVQISYLT